LITSRREDLNCFGKSLDGRTYWLRTENPRKGFQCATDGFFHLKYLLRFHICLFLYLFRPLSREEDDLKTLCYLYI